MAFKMSRVHQGFLDTQHLQTQSRDPPAVFPMVVSSSSYYLGLSSNAIYRFFLL